MEDRKSFASVKIRLHALRLAQKWYVRESSNEGALFDDVEPEVLVSRASIYEAYIRGGWDAMGNGKLQKVIDDAVNGLLLEKCS